MPSPAANENKKFLGQLIFWLGIGLIIIGIVILGYSFFPLIFSELKYNFSQPRGSQPTDQNKLAPSPTPIDDQFDIIIPKIGANAPIVADVDPYDANIYQTELAKGVAHAKGSGLPTENKTMFLFAHASGDIVMARRYNSVFYLLRKLEAGDEIKIFYLGQPYDYAVTDVKEVEPTAISYLANDPATDLILMTCTPPGTNWKRLLVFAKRTNLAQKF